MEDSVTRPVSSVITKKVITTTLDCPVEESGGVRILVESDAPDNPTPTVLQLSRRYRVEILSMVSFHENRLRGKDLSIFRFGNRLPAGFLQEITKAGYRIVSLEG